MAIARPTKTGGTRTYVDEVAIGQDLIRENEVDDDFRVIYEAFNGVVDGGGGQVIPCASLNLVNCIKDEDITAPSAGPGFGINATKIFGEFPPTTIHRDALAVGAATWAIANVSDSTTRFLTGTETTITSLTWTSRSAAYMAQGRVVGRVAVQPGEDVIITLKLYAIAAGGPNLLDESALVYHWPIPAPAPTFPLNIPYAVTMIAATGLNNAAANVWMTGMVVGASGPPSVLSTKISILEPT